MLDPSAVGRLESYTLPLKPWAAGWLTPFQNSQTPKKLPQLLRAVAVVRRGRRWRRCMVMVVEEWVWEEMFVLLARYGPKDFQSEGREQKLCLDAD